MGNGRHGQQQHGPTFNTIGVSRTFLRPTSVMSKYTRYIDIVSAIWVIASDSNWVLKVAKSLLLFFLIYRELKIFIFI